jgi:DNA replication ATP-dependent helicase Dna2
LLEPEARVRFINTDTLASGGREEARGNRIVNHAEATIVVQLVEALLAVGVPENEIGVMTHYRSQLSLLRHGLRARSGVEMHTADRFQGRDKEVVVLSLVRSNEGHNIGELLKDWRRINVAFTRAKTKLLVVGSRETLKGCGKEEMVSKFVGLMEERAWVSDLPPNALESHYFEEMATQATGGATMASMAQNSPSPRKVAKSPLRVISPLKASPRKVDWSGGSRSTFGGALADQENRVPKKVKKARIGEKVLLGGKAILRDIMNDMADGGY